MDNFNFTNIAILVVGVFLLTSGITGRSVMEILKGVLKGDATVFKTQTGTLGPINADNAPEFLKEKLQERRG